MRGLFFKAIFIIIVGLFLWLFNKEPKTLYELAYGTWSSSGNGGTVRLLLNKDNSYQMLIYDSSAQICDTIMGKYDITGAYTGKGKPKDNRLKLYDGINKVYRNYGIAELGDHKLVLEYKYNDVYLNFEK